LGVAIQLTKSSNGNHVEYWENILMRMSIAPLSLVISVYSAGAHTGGLASLSASESDGAPVGADGRIYAFIF
jgi:hypothetical protein